MNKKIQCTKCGEEKLISEFYKNKSKKTGRQSQCKTCEKAYKDEYGKTDHAKELKRKSYHKPKNRERALARAKEKRKCPKWRANKSAQDKAWREANKERKAASDKAYREKNKEKLAAQAKARYLKNKERILANLKEKRKDPEHKKKKAILDKKWRDKNPEHLRKYFRDRARRLSKTCPMYKLRSQIRKGARRVNEGMLGKHKTRKHSLEQLGCTIKEYRAHIESQWEDWMNWENYGPDLDTQWQIDHIIPIDWFMKNSDNPWKANHFTNQRPLKGRDNLNKSNNYEQK